MQQTLFVTVQGTQGDLDLELPGDIPIDDLIPLLLEMCNPSTESPTNAGENKTSWTLHIANLDEPLRTIQTLLESGVLDGDVLLLQTQDAQNEGAAKTRREGFTRSIEPSAQTGMIGVTWEKEWQI